MPRNPAAPARTPLAGTFRCVVYSPKGAVEGALLEVDGAPAQLVFDRDDEDGPRAFGALRDGQRVEVDVVALPPSDKGKGAHPVHGHAGLRSVDGAAPAAHDAEADDGAYRGTVVRLNHARHGAPNGVVLDSGDFVHLKPEGMKRLGLKVGDAVVAHGDAHALATGSGWAVEAVEVNGRSVRA